MAEAEAEPRVGDLAEARYVRRLGEPLALLPPMGSVMVHGESGESGGNDAQATPEPALGGLGGFLPGRDKAPNIVILAAGAAAMFLIVALFMLGRMRRRVDEPAPD